MLRICKKNFIFFFGHCGWLHVLISLAFRCGLGADCAGLAEAMYSTSGMAVSFPG